MSEKCPVCSTDIPNPQLVGQVRAEFYKCIKCGDFAISDNVRLRLKGEKLGNKKKLAAVLRKRMVRGMGRIMIFQDRPSQELSSFPYPIYLLDDLLEEYPENVSDRLNESLINLSKLSKFPGDQVIILSQDMPLFFAQSDSVLELVYIIKQLEQDDLIEVATSSDAILPAHITVTVKGWNRIAELEKVNGSETKQVFVAMWFDSEMDSVYKNAIAMAVKEAGYDPIRIDKVEHNNKIDDEIIAKIKQSKFVIADFTGHRGGVYFEAGYAMGLGKPVIWTCREDDLTNLHFDTRQYSHIVWKEEMELKELLLNRIRATIN
ncbi:TPA: nucleoside 2-deoxyribosyltransferase [Bacillus cereus]|uniref:nucleoside 2-deoxyribosyltransferase n=1 Tax=Bacillus cereus TaxID=1396 RepID=UPI001F27C9B5|nr:nucleoside 2-deoxyribosyltransferase [Bacillus cereus]MCE7034538.1 nucleoside 2-deoxyribosyltransferase [Bacillus cereus]